jgi:hypothetical protein
MKHRSHNASFPAFRRGARFWSLALFVTAGTARVDAQQQLPIPPVFKDLAALGVPVNPGQQPAIGGAEQRTSAANGTSDPNHVFDNTGTRSAAAAGPAPTVLVLRNGRAVQGKIRADSRGYFVEAPRSSLYFPFEHVKFVAADMHDAYVKLCDSLTGTSVRRDLLLGRWCVENDLRAEGAAHFRNALNVEPSNREARLALANLEESQPQEPSQERGAKMGSPSADVQHPESLSRLSGSAVREFVLGIQPIVLARCGSVKCHGAADPSSPGATSFRLEHVRLSQGSNRAATARNLEAVLTLLDGQFPSQSPLFQKGLQPHGGLLMRSPLDGPAGRAQEMRLRRWVESIAAERNRVRHEDTTRAFVSRFARSQNPPTLRDPDVAPVSAAMEGPGNVAIPPEQTAPPADTSPGLENRVATPRQLGPLTDPFDPAQFNAGQSNSR